MTMTTMATGDEDEDDDSNEDGNGVRAMKLTMLVTARC